MKTVKRIFGGKRRIKQQRQVEGKSEVSDPFANHVIVPAESEKPTSDELIKEGRKCNSSPQKEKVAGLKASGKRSFKTSPKIVLESKQGAKKESPVKQSEIRSKTNASSSVDVPSGKRASVLKWSDDDKMITSSSKSGSEGAGKKANANNDLPSPVKDKVDEVVIPQSNVEDRHSTISRAYDSIPLLEQTKLPRGGISVETEAVGRVQFGIPPETIKDSMRLGIPVPQIYIVPAERFCRDMGPALGVNLAEFEFPGYFNFFVRQKTCTLVVDSQDAEDNICRVFEETLLGPKKFRRKVNPVPYDEQDFAPDFPKEAIPNFQKELEHFRDMGNGKELNLGMILKFCHFLQPHDGCCHDELGVPPNLDVINDDEVNDLVQQDYDEAVDEFDDAEKEDEDETETTFEVKEVPKDEEEIRALEKSKSKWSYGRARWVGDVATVWPSTATDEEKSNRSVPRVEIFKMPSGTEYIIHDVNADNIVIGRARFSGNVKVNESMGLEGFGDNTLLDELEDDKFDGANHEVGSVIPRSPPSFYPPSFGVTILGNSHGFDPSGSVSGYVLWINGRGLMIDPPPYASATLEREGIRPRTIVGIILTHTHSDHDAGAFQKVLTGSPVVVITTPTIYHSFIRKYAALASLNPALLRHCHRYKPAIIGQDLRFQGATFKFFYSLHSIPCVGFRVEWRGRSIVFSGDHLHDPVMIKKLQEKGVLSKGRADDMLNRPLQETDLLLHEAGVPPLHTLFKELEKLPSRVKKRMYVVHSSKIPEEFDLRKAPTGTAGTLRLDELNKDGAGMARCGVSTYANANANNLVRFESDEVNSPWDSAGSEYVKVEGGSQDQSDAVPRSNKGNIGRNSMIASGKRSIIPLVSMRPTSNTDSWYMLNLLQAVPFLTSLPYTSTMEVLESTRVEAVNTNDIVVPAARRNEILCVIWEGTCVERKLKSNSISLPLIEEDKFHVDSDSIAVWHSGDWTGPISLQPEKRLSGDKENAANHDIVATSKEGVKVITLEFKNLHKILKNGSSLYRKYLKRQKPASSTSDGPVQSNIISQATEKLLKESSDKLNILELIDMNTGLRKLTAVQKRHLECLAEGPIAFNPGERLWKAGAVVDKAFLVVAGTASFVIRRSNSVRTPTNPGMLGNFDGGLLSSKGEVENGLDTASDELGDSEKRMDSDSDDDGRILLDYFFGRTKRSTMSDADDFDRLSKTLIKRAESLGRDDISVCSSHDDFSQSSDGQNSMEIEDDRDRRKSLTRRRSSRARFVNKALVRLYDRRAFTGGLVFSRGHFLGDVSKMVAGLLSNAGDCDGTNGGAGQGDEYLPSYGFGEKKESKSKERQNLSNMIIHEKDGGDSILHTSTLTAEKEGCIVLVFPRKSLTEFLDAHPGLLLSLLGTQVIV